MTYPLAKLGRFLRHRSEFVTIDDTLSYKRLRVQLHGKGVLLRDEVPGGDIKTKKHQIVRAGDFLVAEIDAKVGGFGFVPRDLDGGIVSSHYFLFEIDESVCLRGWLDAYVRSGQVEEQVKARGSTNYAAIRPDRVLEFEIPLPPLSEQRQIVARHDQLAAKIGEGQHLYAVAARESRGLLQSAFDGVARDARHLPMSDIAPVLRRAIEIDVDSEYPELGIRSFGKGSFHKTPLKGIDVGSKKLFEICPGDLVFNNVFAWEGAVAVAQLHDRGYFGSHRFITCLPKEGIATAEYLRFFFLTPTGLTRLSEASPGGAGRNRTLGLEALSRILVPVPRMEKQLWFDGIQARLGEVADVRAACAAALDGLVRSALSSTFEKGSREARVQ